MKQLDLKTWKRKEMFDLYFQFDIPQISLCTPLEVSKVYNYAKKERLSFYFCLSHIFYTALLKFEEFKIRSIKGELVIEDCEYVNICALKKGDELFKIITDKYHPNIKTFCQNMEKTLQEQTKFTQDLPEGARKSQVIAYISCTPWFEFSQITHPQDVQKNSFVPHISFDKMKENDKGERWINVSIQVNHAVVDGLLIAKLLDQVKEIMSKL